MTVDFDAATRTYRLDGARVLGVRQALTIAGRIKTRFAEDKQRARERWVRDWCDGVDTGRSDLALARSADVRGYCDAWRAFVAQSGVQFAQVRPILGHDELHYAGRPHRVVADLHGQPGVLTIHLGARARWHGVQAALYQLLRPVGLRYGVLLSDSGRYTWEIFRDADDYRDGIAAVKEAIERTAHEAGTYDALLDRYGV